MRVILKDKHMPIKKIKNSPTTFLIRNWQLFVFVVGVLLSAGALLNRIDAIDAQVAAKADRSSVDQHFASIEDKINNVQKGIDYLVKIHVKQ
jgi:hypothetical protein